MVRLCVDQFWGFNMHTNIYWTVCYLVNVLCLAYLRRVLATHSTLFTKYYMVRTMYVLYTYNKAICLHLMYQKEGAGNKQSSQLNRPTLFLKTAASYFMKLYARWTTQKIILNPIFYAPIPKSHLMCVKVPIGQTKNNLIPANIFYYNVAEGKNGSEKKINKMWCAY